MEQLFFKMIKYLLEIVLDLKFEVVLNETLKRFMELILLISDPVSTIYSISLSNNICALISKVINAPKKQYFEK